MLIQASRFGYGYLSNIWINLSRVSESGDNSGNRYNLPVGFTGTMLERSCTSSQCVPPDIFVVDNDYDAQTNFAPGSANVQITFCP